MSLRSTKSRISGKIAAGGFKQPDNTLAKAIDTGAGIMAKGIMKRGEEEREEKRVAKREAAAEAKRLAAAQAKKEEEARKNQRIANSIATRFGIDPRNAQAMAYVTNEVEVYGTDAVGVIQKDFDDGKFTLPDVENTEEFVTGASPNQAPPMRLSPNPDGSMRTTLGLQPKIDDLEATGEITSEEAQSERDYLLSRLNPQQLNKGEVQTASTTNQGFAFDPLAKKNEIDWVSITDPADVANLRRLHDAGRQVLSEVDLNVLALYEKDFEAAKTAEITATNIETSRKILLMNEGQLEGVLQATDDVYDKNMKDMAQKLLDKKKENNQEVNIEVLQSLATMDPTARENLKLSLADATDPKFVATREALDLMTAKKGADLSSYFTGISTSVAVEGKILAVKNSNLSAEDKKTVVDQLKTHLTKIDTLTTELKLTDQTFYADIKGEDGTVSTIELVAKEGGGFYSYALNKSYGSTDLEKGTIISADNVKEIRSASSQVQEKVIAPMNARRSDVTDLLRRAAAIDELVLQSDGKVLTFIGGKLPAIIQRISTEYTNLNGFVSGVEDISKEAYKIATAPENMPTAAELTELGISADQYSRFQAQAIEFAYVYARTAMGQERTTDNDFEYAYTTVTAGSTYATYTKNVRDLVRKGYVKAEEQHNLLLIHPSINAAGMIPNSERAFGDQMVPLAKYLEGQDIQAQLEWMNTEYQAPASADGPSASGTVTPLSVGQQVAKIKNLSGFSDFQSMYNSPRRSPAEKAILAEKIAKQYGVDSASVARALEQKVEQ
jgi:galactitol-specific phosphotransferase system IIB component